MHDLIVLKDLNTMQRNGGKDWGKGGRRKEVERRGHITLGKTKAAELGLSLI